MAEVKIDTHQGKWRTVRDTVTSADTALVTIATSNTTTWANRPSAKMKPLQKNAVAVRIRGTAAAAINYEIYLFRPGDDAEFVASGTATIANVSTTAQLATMKNADVATYYAGKISIASRWMKQAKSSDASGNGEMAKVSFDGCGESHIYVGLTSIAAGNASVDIVEI